MKTINHSDTKRDGTLYRFKVAPYCDAAVVEPNGFIRIIYDIKPTSDMPIIKNIPVGIRCGTADIKQKEA